MSPLFQLKIFFKMNLNLYKVSSQVHIYSWDNNVDECTKKNILIQLFLSNFLQSICVYFETGIPMGAMSESWGCIGLDHVVVSVERHQTGLFVDSNRSPHRTVRTPRRSPHRSMQQTRTLDHIRTPHFGTDSSNDCQSTLGQNKIFFAHYSFLILETDRNNNQNRQ